MPLPITVNHAYSSADKIHPPFVPVTRSPTLSLPLSLSPYIYTFLSLLLFVGGRHFFPHPFYAFLARNVTSKNQKWLGDNGEIVVELPREDESEDGLHEASSGDGDGDGKGKGKGKQKTKVRRFTAVSEGVRVVCGCDRWCLCRMRAMIR